MRGDEGNDPDDEVIITVPVDQQAGVWANWAVVNESDHAFVQSPPKGSAAADLGGPPAPSNVVHDSLDRP